MKIRHNNAVYGIAVLLFVTYTSSKMLGIKLRKRDVECWHTTFLEITFSKPVCAGA